MSSKIPPVLKGGGGAEGVHEKMEGCRGEGLKLEVRDRGLIPVSRTGRAKTISDPALLGNSVAGFRSLPCFSLFCVLI